MINYVTYEEMLVYLKNGKKARWRYFHKNNHIEIDKNGDIRFHEKLTEVYSKHSIFDLKDYFEFDEWEILE
jgi:hypothetical protein